MNWSWIDAVSLRSSSLSSGDCAMYTQAEVLGYFL